VLVGALQGGHEAGAEGKEASQALDALLDTAQVEGGSPVERHVVEKMVESRERQKGI
jgi:hypothetical protein